MYTYIAIRIMIAVVTLVACVTVATVDIISRFVSRMCILCLALEQVRVAF